MSCKTHFLKNQHKIARLCYPDYVIIRAIKLNNLKSVNFYSKNVFPMHSMVNQLINDQKLEATLAILRVTVSHGITFTCRVKTVFKI